MNNYDQKPQNPQKPQGPQEPRRPSDPMGKPFKKPQQGGSEQNR